MKEERMTSSVPYTPHDDYHTTINLMHSAQAYRMIGVEWLSEKHPFVDKWYDCHYLIVEVGSNKLIRYTFMVDGQGSNSMWSVGVEDISFEDALLKYTKDVCRDGQATLRVIPM